MSEPCLLNDLAHGKPPVAEVCVTDRIVSHIFRDSLDALSDYRGTEMSHMKRLCYVCSAVIYYDRERVFRLFNAEFLSIFHACKVFCEKCFSELYVDKARHNCLHILKSIAPRDLVSHCFCYIYGCLFVCFCGSHRAVALIFTEIRTV